MPSVQAVLTAAVAPSYTVRSVGRRKIKGKMVSVRLSDRTIDLLAKLAEAAHPDKTAAMEAAVEREAAARGITSDVPPPPVTPPPPSA